MDLIAESGLLAVCQIGPYIVSENRKTASMFVHIFVLPKSGRKDMTRVS